MCCSGLCPGRLSLSRTGDSATSLGNLYQCLTSLTEIFFSYVRVEFRALPLFLSLSTMRRGGFFLEGMILENQPAILDPISFQGHIPGSSSAQIHELAKSCSPQDQSCDHTLCPISQGGPCSESCSQTSHTPLFLPFY